MWEDTAGFPNGECEASPHLQCQDEVKSLTLAFFLEWLRNGFIIRPAPRLRKTLVFYFAH